MMKALFADSFFLGLLLRRGSSHTQALLRHVEQANLPKSLPEVPFSLPAYTETYEMRLSRIHPTWLQDGLSLLSPFENRILEEARHIDDKHWIGNRFKKQIQERLWMELLKARPNLIPFTLCRPDVLIPLSQIPIQQYENAWFILGLRDLASSFKKTIDARIIRLVQSSLNSKEQELLKIYSQEKEVVSFPKLDIDPNITTKELRDKIFERGINRMAKGFKELNADALWHFTRFLPKVYGMKLQQLSISSISPEISQILFQQAYETVMQGGSS